MQALNPQKLPYHQLCQLPHRLRIYNPNLVRGTPAKNKKSSEE